ncbi:MAG: adenosylcobinamide-phosphate synthase CbiB [Actinomycetota bacterium]
MSSVAASIGIAVDRALGEPPADLHPVASFGTVMRRAETSIYADQRLTGGVYAAIGVGLGIGAGVVAQRVLGRPLATVLATAVCAAGRMLDDEARAVADLLRAGDLDAARGRLRSLVGRNTTELDSSAVSRAVIESLAENGVDAVMSSWWWAAVGGAPAVLAHRASNTLDAMVGHRNERYRRFGWASARLDDVLNFLPARVTAAAVAVSRPARAREVWRTVRRDAAQHPSPNGGVVEAAFAAALGVQLGGANRYGDTTEDRGTLGDGRPAHRTDIDRAIRLRRDATTIVGIVGPLIAAAGRSLVLRR